MQIRQQVRESLMELIREDPLWLREQIREILEEEGLVHIIREGLETPVVASNSNFSVKSR